MTNDKIAHLAAVFTRDGRRVLFIGNEPGRPARMFVQTLAGGSPRAITSEGTVGLLQTPDGRFVIARDPERKQALYPIEGGEPRPIPGLEPADAPVQFSADGRSLYALRREGRIGKLHRIDLETGRREFVREIVSSSGSGIGALLLTPDGKSYVYGYGLQLSDLYLVQGLK